VINKLNFLKAMTR